MLLEAYYETQIFDPIVLYSGLYLVRLCETHTVYSPKGLHMTRSF